MMWWIKLLLGLVWSTIIILSSFILYDLVTWLVNKYSAFIYLYYGMGAYILFRYLIPQKTMIFFNVFFHELSHAIFALITFSPLRSFVVSPHSNDTYMGYVEHAGSGNKLIYFVRSHFVSLAPYFFSPITVLAIGLYYLLIPYDFGYTTTINILLAIIGFSYLYHVSVSFKDMRPYQTDFAFLGFNYSVIFVIMMQLIFLIFFILILSSKLYSFYQFKLILNRRIYDIYNWWDSVQDVFREMLAYLGGLL